VIVAAVLAVFVATCGHDFVSFDDYLHLHDNPHLNPPSWSGLWQLWIASYKSEFVPLSYTLYALEAWLGQLPPEEYGGRRLDPAVFHATSVLLHTLTTIAVLGLLRTIVQNTWAACGGALCFALHPLQVESVAWVSETRGLLAGLFSVLALWQYVSFVSDRKSRSRYVAATILFLLALLSKTSAAPVPLIALILDGGLLSKSWRQALRWTLPWFVLAAVFAVIMKSLQTNAQIEFITPVWARPLIAADALQFYLTKLFVPLDLAIQYDRHPRTMMGSPWLWAAWIVPVAIVALLFALRQKRMLWVPAALFAAGFAPVLGLTPFLFQNFSTVADRYAYLPMLGPSLAISALLAHYRSRAVGLVAGCVLLAWAIISYAQTAHWQNSMTLYQRALDVNPRSHLAHNNLATDYIRAGDHAAALKHAEAAVEAHPASFEAHLLRALSLSGVNRTDEAIAEYEGILERDPDYSVARLNLGVLYYRQGRMEEAISQYETVLQKSPHDADAHRKLGALLAAEGRLSEALPHLTKSVEISPQSAASHVELATALAIHGEPRDAVVHYQAALALQPADWHIVAHRLARLLATHPDPAVRNGPQAVSLAEAACRQTEYAVPELLQTLAAAYAETQRFMDAEQTAAKALAQTGVDKPVLRNELEANLASYRQRKPWRQTEAVGPEAHRQR
jgi:tetratricopeptide (TPR) repeat protein